MPRNLNRYPGSAPLEPIEERWHTALVELLNNLLNLVQTGAGSPEGVVTAPQGTIWLRTDGGAATSLFVKASGGIVTPTNTGWQALS